MFYNKEVELPLVSVVIPAYNAAKWLPDTINSILNQTYPNIEIIIVDDGSTDNTIDIISKFTNIKYIKNKINIGECASSRRGFEEAKGYYISRLSADDLYANPNKIKHQVETMERTKVDWSYFSINRMGNTLESSDIIYSILLPLPVRYNYKILQIFNNFILKFPYIVLLRILIVNPINCNTLMFKKSSYIKSSKWSDTIRTDCDALLLYTLFLQQFKCISIQEMGSFYRIHPNQMTNDKNYINIRSNNRLNIIKEISDGNYPIWLKFCVKIIKKFNLYNL